MSEGQASDEELARSYARNGDRDAFAELSRRMAPMTRRLFLALFCGSLPDVEDAEQETLAGLLTALQHFDGRSSAKTYWYRVARNTGVSLLRSRGRQRRIRNQLEVLGVRPDPPRDADPEQHLLEREALEEYYDLLSQLPEKDRVLLHLFYVEEQTIAELSVALGVPEGTLKSKLHRIRRRMRKRRKQDDE